MDQDNFTKNLNENIKIFEEAEEHYSSHWKLWDSNNILGCRLNKGVI